jgi:hypothetical protein
VVFLSLGTKARQDVARGVAPTTNTPTTFPARPSSATSPASVGTTPGNSREEAQESEERVLVSTGQPTGGV